MIKTNCFPCTVYVSEGILKMFDFAARSDQVLITTHLSTSISSIRAGLSADILQYMHF